MTDITLPAGYEDLQPYTDWALPTADQRQAKRRASSKEDLRSVYDAILPRLKEILAEADKSPLGKLPAEMQPLYNMALSLAEIAPHIELYRGNPAVPYAFEESRFVAAHGDLETWRAEPPMPRP